MPKVVALTSLLLAVLLGAAAWTAWPSGRSLSWVQSLQAEFAVVARVDRSEGRPRLLNVKQKAVDTPVYLARLRRTLGPAPLIYSLPGRGVSVLVHEKRSWPGVDDVGFLGDYFRARELRPLYGRLPTPGRSDEGVIGFTLARQMTHEVRTLVGQRVQLGETSLTLVGVLAPSARQDEFADADRGVARELTASELRRDPLWATLPMQFLIVAPTREVTRVRDLTRDFVARQLPSHQFVDVQAANAADDTLRTLQGRVDRRTWALAAFALVLGASGLFTLFAHALAALLRRRALLGVERALGATRAQQWRALLSEQLRLALPAAALGTAALWFLPKLAPTIFIGHPPLGVQLLALLGPAAALTLLTVMSGATTLKLSAYAMLRAAKPTERLGRLFALIYLGLALGLAGTLSALTVWHAVNAQANTLSREFTPLWSLETGSSGLDRRRSGAFDLQSVTPRLTVRDEAALKRLDGVDAAAVAQNIGGELRFGRRTVASPKGVAASASYFDVLGLRLSEGAPGGCVLNRRLLNVLGARVGSVITVPGVERPVACTVSGVLAPVDPLYPWLIQDYPDFVAPPLPGLGPSILNGNGRALYDTGEFRSTRVLLRLSPRTRPEAVEAAFTRTNPTLAGRFALVPYAPNASQALSALKAQAQLFLVLAVLACALCVWGLAAGFFAILDASRFRLAVERAYGLSAARAAWSWWHQQTFLGVLSGFVAALAALALAKPMYDAFALDVPTADPFTVLPEAGLLVPTPGTLALLALALATLSLALTWAGHRWLVRQPISTLLKEGA